MRDILQHVTDVVRDELTLSCQANGIDKSEVGYAVGGFGALTFIMTPGGQGVSPAWVVTMTLRHKLLGHDALAASLPIPLILPSDTDFRMTVNRLLGELVEAREREFRGEPNGNGPIDPSQVIVLGKDQTA